MYEGFERRISQRDRDAFAARARKEFWARKQAEAERDAALANGTWFKAPVPDFHPVGTW